MVKIKWSRYLFLIAVLLLWEGVAMSGHYNSILFPRIETIAGAFWADMLSGALIRAVIYSVYVIAKGLLVAILIGGVLVLLARCRPWMEDIVELFVTVAHPLPGIAILPLVILWFGIGEKAILFVVVHSMLWPMVITLKAGIEQIHHRYARVGKAFHFSLSKRLIHLYGMGAVPSLITGAKIGWSRGWRAFISAEMVFGIVGQKSGLGWYIFEQRVYMNTPKLFGGLLTIMLCGLIIERLIFEKAENAVAKRWY
ncbi:MAG: ABC transporter permease subunit [Clostridia bacterium]|nr:ABC transporter permease subunit [Clostridia bacterium]